MFGQISPDKPKTLGLQLFRGVRARCAPRSPVASYDMPTMRPYEDWDTYREPSVITRLSPARAMVQRAAEINDMDTNTEPHPDTKVWEAPELSDSEKAQWAISDALYRLLRVIAPDWEVEAVERGDDGIWTLTVTDPKEVEVTAFASEADAN